MAIFPCEFQPHRFRGSADTYYVGLVDGAEATRWKLRCCPDHSKFVLDGLLPDEVTDSTQMNNVDPPCPSCGLTVHMFQERVRNLYVTAYRKGEERRDFWAVLHQNCGTPAWLPYTREMPERPRLQ